MNANNIQTTEGACALIKSSKLVHLDVQPFLTQSQLDNGFDSSWFKLHHLRELLELLRAPLEVCVEEQDDTTTTTSDKKKAENKTNKEVVLTGSSVRVACSFRLQPESDICLVRKTRLPGKSHTADGTPQSRTPSWCHIALHPEKVLCFVCPRSNSSTLQLSQIVNTSLNREHEDISKYFQLASS